MTLNDVAKEAESCSKLLRQFLGIKQTEVVEPFDLDILDYEECDLT
jgi:hypothetical protein